MVSEKTKKIIRIAWTILLLAGVVFYVLFSSSLNEHTIISFLKNYQNQMLGLYFILCILRGFILIPSTPFLFAGIILFPTKPFLLLGVFMVSLIITSALLYYASEFVGLDHYFRRVHPEKMRKFKQKMNGPRGFWFILLWSFAPFTPTDLVCCVAGSLRMQFRKFIIPLIFGEALISSFYIFNGTTLIRHYL